MLVLGDQMRWAADEFTQLTQNWDTERAEGLFVSPRHAAFMQLQLEWFHQELGACISWRVLGVSSGPQARFELYCQYGTLSLGMSFASDGKVRSVRAGTPDVDPPLRVAKAASALVAWQSGERIAPKFRSPKLAEAFERDFRRGVDAERCRLGDAMRVSRSGALYALQCEGHEDRMLILDLDEKDRLRRAMVRPLNPRG